MNRKQPPTVNDLVRLNRKQRRRIKREAKRQKTLPGYDTTWQDVETKRAAKDILARSKYHCASESVVAHAKEELEKMGLEAANSPPALAGQAENLKTANSPPALAGQAENLKTAGTLIEFDKDDDPEEPDFGIFSHAERRANLDFEIGDNRTPGTQRTHECYSFDDRPIINGLGAVPDRRMYQSAAYLTAARKLQVGLEEKKSKKTVIWLSVGEHGLVYEYVKLKKRTRSNK
tara:strand:+ start:1429 stop:2124 length:696 start_codon:yes stop_codon:yes gene_type:complete